MKSGTQIHPLTGMRFLGAAFVMLYHFRNKYGLDLQKTIPALEFGYLGVDLFFILSGFVIFHVYQDQFCRGTLSGPLQFASNAISFYVARFARIYPVHAFVLLVYAAYALAGALIMDDPNLEPYGLPDLISQVFLVHGWNYDNSTHFTWNPVSWSISAEMFGYLLFPLLMYAVLSIRSLLFHAGILILSLVLAFAFVGGSDANQLNEHGLLRFSFEFPSGAALYVIWTRLRNYRLPWDAIVIASLVALFAYLSVTRPEPASPSNLATYGNQAVVLIPMMVLILALASCNGMVARVLSSRTALFLGESSYALYMIHYFIGIQVFQFLYANTNLISGVPAYFAAIVVSLVAGAIIHVVVERPARRFIRLSLSMRRIDLGTAQN